MGHGTPGVPTEYYGLKQILAGDLQAPLKKSRLAILYTTIAQCIPGCQKFSGPFGHFDTSGFAGAGLYNVGFRKLHWIELPPPGKWQQTTVLIYSVITCITILPHCLLFTSSRRVSWGHFGHLNSVLQSS